MPSSIPEMQASAEISRPEFIERLRPSTSRVRAFFWIVGLLLAAGQLWTNRYYMSADAISYLDMSDAVMPGYPWSRLINGVWSPLYPFLIGVARRVAKPSPAKEIVFAHVLNILIFAFAFVCFEFLLHSILARRNANQSNNKAELLPEWALVSLGYTLFLWASISQIQLQTLRPDMLMSGFVYLAIGLIVRIKAEGPKWSTYLILGLVLGVGFLAKAPILPIGILLLIASLLFVENWRVALGPAICAGLLMLAVSSAYFIPLSRARGHFTLGESGAFNYLFHVDHAGPAWYIQNPGAGTGTLRHVPHKIFDSPPTYQFTYPYPVTHPLRFDPSYWTVGARPRFRLRNQLGALFENLHLLMAVLATSGGLLVGFLVLLFVADRPKALFQQWPIWACGLLGLVMYAVIHLEHRYVGVFLVLLWLGLLCGLGPSARMNRVLLAVVVGIGLSLLAPLAENIAYEFVNTLRAPTDPDVEAGVALRRLGICDGDQVARIVPMVTDLGWARVSRTTVVAEVDYRAADQFWRSSPQVQKQVLDALGASGAKVVVGYGAANPGSESSWKRLDRTPFLMHAFPSYSPHSCSP